MTKDFPKPSVTVDVIIFALTESKPHLLLIQRKHDPFQDKWAIPGGFVDIDEPLELAAKRELQEETGLTDIDFEQFQSFGDPKRDPRGRTITIAFWTLLPEIPKGAKGADDAADARWFAIDQLPELAFDHAMILQKAITELRARLHQAVRAASFFSGDLKISDLRLALKKVAD